MSFTKAEIIADTKYFDGFETHRVTTFKIRFPRIVLTHLLTHRVFSRNTASSRAIPISRMIEYVWKQPYVPSYWGKNQSGMEAEEQVSPLIRVICTFAWLYIFRPLAILSASLLQLLGVHKQIGSRLLEPFYYCEMILTGAEFLNFFNLRDHPKAQPETREIANAMRRAYHLSTPKENTIHIPFYHNIMDMEGSHHFNITDKMILSTALCAKVSYRNEEVTLDGAKTLLKKLLGDGIVRHLSPFEHVNHVELTSTGAVTKGNLRGWVQLRHTDNLKQLLNLDENYEN